MKAEGVQLQSEQKCRKVLLVAKETGTAVHGKTSDMGYFFFCRKRRLREGLNGGNRLYLKTVTRCKLLWTRSLQNPSLQGLKRWGDGQRRRKEEDGD